MIEGLLGLFMLNAFLHVLSFNYLNRIDDPTKMGVLAFVFINLIIAALIYFGIEWAKYPALIFPLIGGIALFTTTMIPKKGRPVDYAILGVDVVTIIVVLFFWIL